MMHRDPARQILESSCNAEKGKLIEFISKPLFSIGFRIVSVPNQTIFNKGNVLFAITFTADIALSIKESYKYHVRSVTEIIDNKKPLAVWALKMLTDEELKVYEQMLKADMKSKGFTNTDVLKVEFNPKQIETFIQEELNDFLSTDKN